MENQIHTHRLSAEKKDDFLRRISDLLRRDSRTLFAYAHGSFLEAFVFRDLDIAIYMDPHKLPHRTYAYETELETVVTRRLKASFPLDVRIMNSAAIPFQYYAFQGRLLVDRNPEMRIQIMTRIASIYLDIAPILAHHTREAFSPHAQS